MNRKALRTTWLCIAALTLAGPMHAEEPSGPAVAPTGPADDSAAKEKYTKLMEQAEGAGRHCMISDTFKQETLESLRIFAARAEFVDLDPGKPIKVTLPQGWYSPLGRTITFDSFELAIEQNDVSRYLSMTRTDKGLLLEPKISIATKDGKILCVGYLSATMEFRAAAPAAAQERIEQQADPR